MNDRILSLLGLCRRAGKLIIGAQPVIDSADAGKSELIIFASDFSKGSAKPVVECAKANGVEIITINRNKEQISLAVGRLCGTASIEDEGFAKKIKELNKFETGGELDG